MAAPLPRLDRVFLADRVHTLDASSPGAQAIGVQGGVIVSVGTRRDAADWDTRHAEIIELGSAVITPGFIDAHAHPISGAERRASYVHLHGADTIAELQERVARAAAGAGAHEWIRGFGMPYTAFDGEPIDNHHFAEAFGGRPGFLSFFDSHACIASDEALRLAGITGAIDFGNSSQVVVDEEGAPTGYLIEDDAQRLVKSLAPSPPLAERKAAVLDTLGLFAASGYTSIHAMNFDSSDIEVLQAIEVDHELPVRLRISPVWESGDEWDKALQRLVALQGVGGRRWRIEGVKLVVDGTVENGTAWLHEPDADGKGTVSQWEPTERFIETMHALIANRIPTATHAIGDRAVEFVLDAIESADDFGHPVPHRIEHIETIPDRTVPRFAQLGVAASMQPMHALSTRADHTDPWSLKLGPNAPRTEHGWRIRDIWETGAVVALGSDWPVEELDARHIFATNLTRQRPGSSDAPVGPDQAITALDTLRQFTQQGWASIGSPENGVIRPGAIADLTVFSRDPLECDTADLPHIAVVMTVVEGSVVKQGVSGAAG